VWASNGNWAQLSWGCLRVQKCVEKASAVREEDCGRAATKRAPFGTVGERRFIGARLDTRSLVGRWLVCGLAGWLGESEAEAEAELELESESEGAPETVCGAVVGARLYTRGQVAVFRARPPAVPVLYSSVCLCVRLCMRALESVVESALETVVESVVESGRRVENVAVWLVGAPV